MESGTERAKSGRRRTKSALGILLGGALVGLVAPACSVFPPLLDISVSPASGGTVHLTGCTADLRACGDACTCAVRERFVQLQAVPEEGFAFGRWTGSAPGCAGVEPSIEIDFGHDPSEDARFSCEAEFMPLVAFDVAVTPKGSGKVGVGTNRCASRCVQVAAKEESFRLHAYPEPGYRFTGWTTSGADRAISGCEGVKLEVVTKVHAEGGICTASFAKDTPSTRLIVALALQPDDGKALLDLLKSGDDGACTPLSDDSMCVNPEEAQRLALMLDPLLEVSPAAATRLFHEVFPCGDGPVGRTVCASPGPPPAGEWVFLENVFGADVVLDDPVGIYQHAWVFDADGIASNNYVPGPQFPKDFFAGTDKWYELTYAPGPGWAARVRDVRLGIVDVASHARFVIVDDEIGIFLPRSELDGAAPTFRTTAFRHEGDYGLSGGPWSGDYYPVLDQPLLAVDTGTPIVVPE
jgi:hypothetical protein